MLPAPTGLTFQAFTWRAICKDPWLAGSPSMPAQQALVCYPAIAATSVVPRPLRSLCRGWEVVLSPSLRAFQFRKRAIPFLLNTRRHHGTAIENSWNEIPAIAGSAHDNKVRNSKQHCAEGHAAHESSIQNKRQ